MNTNEMEAKSDNTAPSGGRADVAIFLRANLCPFAAESSFQNLLCVFLRAFASLRECFIAAQRTHAKTQRRKERNREAQSAERS